MKCDINSGVKAYYTFGETDAISFSPFALDEANYKVKNSLRRSYKVINQLSPLLLQHQGKGKTGDYSSIRKIKSASLKMEILP